ncbi:hypothetical protein [Petrimonas sp.]|uniref:hypothetical protein n=1 Tax=Petrimonas sp. TaxID=2023866 RepID=UPI003F518902
MSRKNSNRISLKQRFVGKTKKQAKKENRSMNNFLETILFDAVYRELNEETLSAMREAESGAELETLRHDKR